ncbi:UNKNOWN [Stylonychia lemnae]|uniref:F5/8 type C domain-containing protein n=1 Tax=Stylonychia lemnae TaxID=5949 RepID=A0A078A6X8_STYLE|nr:UNKNOWN [Stylonychia lemnae]|eukprot:CDW78010.1 UNKNOWN [Stylonychia lemnae]
MKSIKFTYKAKTYLQIEGVESSSQYANKSIFCSVYRNQEKYYWSSIGSENEQNQEYLIYKLTGNKDSQKALITSVVLQFRTVKYAFKKISFTSKQIQIEIGDEFDKYHYKSRNFDVQQENGNKQTFSILPDVVCGEFIKITLLGIPIKSRDTWLHHIQLKYIGIRGQIINYSDNNDAIK